MNHHELLLEEAQHLTNGFSWVLQLMNNHIREKLRVFALLELVYLVVLRTVVVRGSVLAALGPDPR